MSLIHICPIVLDAPLASCLQLLLSAFSHTSPLHLFVNMFVLHNVTKSEYSSLYYNSMIALYVAQT